MLKKLRVDNTIYSYSVEVALLVFCTEGSKKKAEYMMGIPFQIDVDWKVVLISVCYYRAASERTAREYGNKIVV